MTTGTERTLTTDGLSPDLKTKWLEALRSTKYTQGEDRLRDRESNCYCCLGVALDLIDPNGWHPTHVNGQFKWKDIWTGDVAPVAPLLGISESTAEKLAQMNDGKKGEQKHTFPEIADWIEANL